MGAKEKVLPLMAARWAVNATTMYAIYIYTRLRRCHAAKVSEAGSAASPTAGSDHILERQGLKGWHLLSTNRAGGRRFCGQEILASCEPFIVGLW